MSVPGLTRDADHNYFYNGKPVVGVTRAVGMLRDFAGIGADVLRSKAELGELVHRATELDAIGTLDHETIDPEVMPYMRAWWRFREECKPVITSCEEYVYHPVYRYAGQLDHEMRIGEDEGIVDKKTGVEDLADAVQLSAYLEAKYHDKPLERQKKKLWILSLRADGKYRLRKYDNHMHVFLAALTCHRFKNGDGK